MSNQFPATDDEIFADADMLVNACGTADAHAELAGRVKHMANYLRECDPHAEDIQWLDDAVDALTRAAAFRAGVPSGDQYDRAMTRVIDEYVSEVSTETNAH